MVDLAIAAGWKYRTLVSGNDQNHPPGFYGITLDTILTAPVAVQGTVPYTGTEVTNVSTDNDSTFTSANIANAPSTTCRSNHLWRFDGISMSPDPVTTLEALTRYTHLISGNHLVQQHRLYIWNFQDDNWFQLDARTSAADPRTMSGGPTMDFANYVGSGSFYILIWDWEGVFQTGGGGCVHEDTILTLESGRQVRARDARFGQRIRGPRNTLCKIEEHAIHYADGKHPLVTVTAGPGLWYAVSADHMCPVGDGQMQADEIRVGMMVPDSRGELHPVQRVKRRRKPWVMVDINIRNPALEITGTYEVNGGLLTCNMPKD